MPRLITALRPGIFGSPVFYFFSGLLLLTTFLYWPALHGPFVFDDFAPTNLPALGDYSGVRNWATLKLYLAQAHAGPTGRPVAMLSFLLNANDWPAESFPFKLTNLLLHLVNGALLYLVLRQLLRLRENDRKAALIALVAAACWLIHPMFVSTVLYVVQRMAMLPVTFTLLGFLAYLHGRRLLPALRGYIWMTAGAGIATGLATLSKENGALLPLLLLITELIWCRPNTEIQPDRRWLALVLGLPAIAVIGRLLVLIPKAESAYSMRPFTLEERLLTEARIVCQYLWHIFFPRLHGSGLFHDSYTISQGLLSPLTTLTSVLAIAGLLISAGCLHRRFPLYALAVFFFFAGHLVESTVIPLELYYEHRNYLPALFLFLPAAAAMVNFCQLRRIYILLPVTLVALLSGITFQRIQTWKDEPTLLTTWAMENPASVRAQIYGALALQNQLRHGEAFALLLQGLKYNPHSFSLNLYALSYECVLHLDAHPRLAKIRVLLEKSEFDFHDNAMFSNALRNIHDGRCRTIPPTTIYPLLDQLENNRAFEKHPGSKRLVAHWRGEFLLADGKPEQALEEFLRSQKILPDLEAGMMQVSLLAGSKHYDKALNLLSMLEQLRQKGRGIKPGLNYAQEMERIRLLLLDDLTRAAGATTYQKQVAHTP